MTDKAELDVVPGCLKAARDTAAETEEGSGQYLLTPEQYERLDEAIGQAGREDIITPLPGKKPTSPDAYSNPRLNTIRDRLRLLGYVESVEEIETWEALEREVKRFQQAAFGEERLTRDGWVGEQTWQALQELVSFEEPSNLSRWLTADGRPCPALQRALHLRLFSLGLIETRPGKTIRPALIDQGLCRFAAVAEALRWSDLTLQTTFAGVDLETLNAIFDQDALVIRLGSSKPPKDKKAIRPFVIAMARIELWLAGYDVIPEGYGANDRVQEEIGGGLLDKSSALYEPLSQYWAAMGADGRSSMAFKVKMFPVSGFPAFFDGIHKLLAAGDGEDPDSETVFEMIRNEDAKNAKKAKSKRGLPLLHQVWDCVHGLGARIWDGLKRAWRWFKAWVVDAVRKIGDFVRNVSRIAYQYILKAYEGVRAVIRGVCGSIAFFTRPVLKLPCKALGVSREDGLVIGRDRDFDFRVLVDADASSEDVRVVSDYVAGKAAVFGMACRFLGSLLNTMLGLLKSLYTGWLGLLMALLKLYKGFARWAPMFIEAQRIEDELESAAA